MGSIGGAELLLILVVALLLFGPRRLPEIGRTIGRALGELRNASRDFQVSLEREVELEQSDRAPLSLEPPVHPSIARGSTLRPPAAPVADQGTGPASAAADAEPASKP